MEIGIAIKIRKKEGKNRTLREDDDLIGAFREGNVFEGLAALIMITAVVLFVREGNKYLDEARRRT